MLNFNTRPSSVRALLTLLVSFGSISALSTGTVWANDVNCTGCVNGLGATDTISGVGNLVGYNGLGGAGERGAVCSNGRITNQSDCEANGVPHQRGGRASLGRAAIAPLGHGAFQPGNRHGLGNVR
jgi:hypothetical protein